MSRNLIPGLVLCAAIAACGGDDDAKPPTVVSITPADGAADVWIHDPITITFSEAIAASSVTAETVSLSGAGGVAVASTATAGDDPSIVTVRAADDVALDGDLTLTLAAGITDKAGNPLEPVTAHWTIPAWSRTGGLDRGSGGATPALTITDAGDALVAWSAGASGARRIVVSRADVGGWTALGGEITAGTGDAFVPQLSGDAQDRPIVLWSEAATGSPTVQAARWDGTTWAALPSPGSGSLAAAGRTLAGDPVIAWVNPNAFGGTVGITVRALVGDAWQPVASSAGDLTVNGTVQGIPQVVVPAAGAPVVAFAETGGGVGVPAPQVRVATFDGNGWSELPPIPLASGPSGTFNRISLAASGGALYLAYDTYSGFSWSVHVVEKVGAGWQAIGGELDVDPPADAVAPALALDAGGAPVVAWRELVEDNWRGFVARWDGAAWRAVGGDAWNTDATRGLVRPAMALHRGHAPIVAWGDQSPDVNGPSAVKAARWSGPATPRFGRDTRASIAGCHFDGSQTTLSATGCFTIAGGRATPHPGLIPFDLVSELWSDGALKRRWIALPDGQGLTAPATGAWTAPVGTLLVKEFAIETTPGDPRTRRPMETRFLIDVGAGSVSTTGWDGYSFRWRADGSDADLLPDAASTVDWPLDTGNVHTHSYPSRLQCTRCHAASNGPVLGLRTGQLARRFDYDGVMADELDTLAHLGVITMPSQVDAFTAPHDPSQPLEARVRGYLAANCAHCHNPAGERPTRDFRWETPLASTMLCGADSEVVAGSPGTSVIVTRISTRVNGMPPLATLATDPLAIDAVTRWIANETSCP